MMKLSTTPFDCPPPSGQSTLHSPRRSVCPPISAVPEWDGHGEKIKPPLLGNGHPFPPPDPRGDRLASVVDGCSYPTACFAHCTIAPTGIAPDVRATSSP